MRPITDTLAGFVLALDDHGWDGVVSCLATSVRRDYRSLLGAEPDDISRLADGRPRPPATGSLSAGPPDLGDRIGALGGQLVIDSPRGRGTTIRATIPCAGRHA